MPQIAELVLLQWFDSTVAAATDVYTTEQALAEKIVILQTIGWMVGETESPYGGCYIIAASKHGSDWRGIQLIPKANLIATHGFDEPTRTRGEKET